VTALGIGVRVWVGWCPDHCLAADILVDGRLQSGTITDGPFHFSGWTGWNVALDSGGAIGANEIVLSPINDGDAGVEVSDAREVTA